MNRKLTTNTPTCLKKKKKLQHEHNLQLLGKNLIIVELLGDYSLSLPFLYTQFETNTSFFYDVFRNYIIVNEDQVLVSVHVITDHRWLRSFVRVIFAKCLEELERTKSES